VTSIPEERDNPGACTLGSNIYIFGGNDVYETETSTTYRFNTQMGEWTTLAPMPRAKAGHSVCVLASLIYIYVVGGILSDSFSEGLTSANCFDPAANSWRALLIALAHPCLWQGMDSASSC
jgi:N-acetylneuraminic acid mutarotase